MTSHYYNPTGNPASNVRGRSSLIRDEFTLLQTALDLVYAEMSARAPIASPTFTGTPAAPTPASLADNTTKIATTAFVQSVLGAAGSLLPIQTTYAGKVLKTNGTVASWDTPYTRYPILSTSTAALSPVSSGEDISWGCGYDTGLGAVNIVQVVYGSGLFVAVSESASGNVATSPDGITWTLRAMPSSKAWKVATDGTNFLAFDTAGTATAKSTNGTTWSSATALPASIGAGGIAVIGTTWVAAFGTTSYVSTDFGTSWSAAQTIPASINNLYAVGSKFFVNQNGGTACYYSTTGLTGSWTNFTGPCNAQASYQDTDGSVKVGSNSYPQQVYKTTNGTSFAAVSGAIMVSAATPFVTVNGVVVGISNISTNCRSIHANGPVPRLSAYLGRTTGTHAAGGGYTVIALSAGNGYVLRYSTTSSPTGLFE